MRAPVGIDLFCGLGGWTDGLLAEGYDVVGFDIERHDYGDGQRYPARLVLQDVLTIHGGQFKGAALIVASPPCQEFSYMAMPWSRAKAKAADYRSGARDVKQLTALFDACFRIQREAVEAAGHFIPLVVENVRGACPWVGRSRWQFGSFHLWGDVPALMPIVTSRRAMKQGIAHRPDGVTNFHGRKVPGFCFDGSGGSFQTASVESGRKNDGGSWFNVGSPGQREVNRNPVHALVGVKTVGHVNKRNGHTHARHLTNQRESDAVKNGGDWFNSAEPSLQRRHGSRSTSRKAASAEIARIPLALARHIARAWM